MNTLNSLLTEKSVIVVSTVAAIYGTANPDEYQKFILKLKVGQVLKQNDLIELLIKSNYERNDFINDGSKFMVKGNIITVGLINNDNFLRITFDDDCVNSLKELESVTFNLLQNHQEYCLFPGNEYVVDMIKIQKAAASIEKELQKTIKTFNQENRFVESYRIKTRTEQDLEELREFGICKGIENYALHFDNRLPGQPAFTLLDFFRYSNDNFITIIDESHITIPQIYGMYYGDRSRKQNLIDFGFRLSTALDNRPLKFDEFVKKLDNVIYASATPGNYELKEIKTEIVEQIVRPTGLLDPVIEIKSTKNQIDDILQAINHQIKNNHRVFILTLTIQMSEDLTKYLQERSIKVAYIHSRLKTFQRTKILINLRKGIFDVVVGINLLREGLDIPEVALVIILDADKAGFLRDTKSLIQMIGRASRNKNGKVFLYADKTTTSMQRAMQETQRRRDKQSAYNQKHDIIPQTIIKPIEDIFLDKDLNVFYQKMQKKDKISKPERREIIKILDQKMQTVIKKMDFEMAAKIRDMIFDLMKNE